MRDESDHILKRLSLYDISVTKTLFIITLYDISVTKT
jgi:hypothetical protein